MNAVHRAAASSPTRSPGVVIRVASEADLDAVVAMRLRLLDEEARSPLYARPFSDAEARARTLTQAHLSSRTDVVLIARQGDLAVGMLRCSISRAPKLVRPSRYGFLTSAYVAPEHRRRGILRALVQAGEEWCRTRGLQEVRLHCTLENVDGNASWEALGYGVAEVVRRRALPGR